MANPTQLKAKLEQAIAAGKEMGADTSRWEEKLRLLSEAEEVASQTRRLLHSQGWCLWECTRLGGDIIAVVRDEHVRGVPPGYPTYTEDELEKLCRVSDFTRRLVHEAKKRGGARVIAVEERAPEVAPPAGEDKGPGRSRSHKQEGNGHHGKDGETGTNSKR